MCPFHLLLTQAMYTRLTHLWWQIGPLYCICWNPNSIKDVETAWWFHWEFVPVAVCPDWGGLFSLAAACWAYRLNLNRGTVWHLPSPPPNPQVLPLFFLSKQKNPNPLQKHNTVWEAEQLFFWQLPLEWITKPIGGGSKGCFLAVAPLIKAFLSSLSLCVYVCVSVCRGEIIFLICPNCCVLFGNWVKFVLTLSVCDLITFTTSNWILHHLPVFFLHYTFSPPHLLYTQIMTSTHG